MHICQQHSESQHKPRLQLVLCALLVCSMLCVALFPSALLVIDSGRDIATAWMIARGDELPLTGPSIYGAWSLGPAWYYLLAVPLVFGLSLTTLVMWVGLLAACKIPLAFLLGRHWHGVSGGLMLGAFVAAPGWNSAGAMIVAHTSVIEAAAFASLLSSVVAITKPTLGRVVFASLVFSFALNAHPTIIVAAPWFLVAVALYIREHRRVLVVASCCAIAFLLPWVTVIASEMSSGWPQISATQHFASTGGFVSRIGNIVPVFSGLISGWSPFVARYLLSFDDSFELALTGVVYAALALGGVGGLIALRDRPILTIGLLVNVFAAIVLVCILRPDAQIYMFFAVFPIGSWALMHCWHRLAGRYRMALAGIFVSAAIAMQVGALVQRWQVEADGTLPFPGEAIANVSTPVRTDSWTRFWLPARDQEEIARTLCGTSTAIHGELASAFAWAAGVAVHNACKAEEIPRYGGADATEHVAGLPLQHARQLGVAGWLLGSGFVGSEPVQVFYPLRGSEIVVSSEYPAERYRALMRESGVKETTVDVSCDPFSVLVVNNLMPGLNQLEVQVTEHETQWFPALTTIAASYYKCSSNLVKIRIAAIDLQAVDIFTLAAGNIIGAPPQKQ